MSAFYVEIPHIDALLTWYEQAGSGHTADELDAMGRELLQENIRSLIARYGNDDETSIYTEKAKAYRWKPLKIKGKLSLHDIISMCDCYDYQACETEDYYGTVACDIIAEIRRSAMYLLYRETKPEKTVWQYRP